MKDGARLLNAWKEDSHIGKVVTIPPILDPKPHN